MIKILILTFSLSATSNALSDFAQGKMLLEWLSKTSGNDPDLVLQGELNGYISGVIDIADGALFCIDSGVSLTQIKAILRKHVKNNPEEWAEPASSIISSSMRSVFPCMKQHRKVN